MSGIEPAASSKRHDSEKGITASVMEANRTLTKTNEERPPPLTKTAANVDREVDRPPLATPTQAREGGNDKEDRPPSPAPYVDEAITEPAPDVEAAVAEPAMFTDTPEVENCKPVESPVVEAARSKLAPKVESCKPVESPVVEAARSKLAPVVESCKPVESPVVEAASSKLSVKNLTVTTKREQKEMKNAAKDNPKKPTIEKMRGEGGPIFESNAAVLRGNRKPSIFKMILQCCAIERDFVTYSEVRRYIMIKSNYLFVFHDVSAAAPLYAVPLGHIQAHLEDPENPSEESYTLSPTGGRNEAGKGLQTVLLREPLEGEQKGKVYYQVTFNERDTNMPDAASRFVELVNRDTSDQSRSSSGVLSFKGKYARKPQTKSVLYAEAVAESKIKQQPMAFSSS